MAREHLRYTGLPQRLSAYRCTHNLPATTLARQAGLSPQAVSQIERGQVIPGIDTVEKISRAAACDPGWLAYGLPMKGLTPHISVVPDYDPTAMVCELCSILMGPGGIIDDAHKYLDPLGAHEWRMLLRESASESLSSVGPLDQLVGLMAPELQDRPTDIVGLGCGTAQHELALARKLLSRRRRDLRLLLIDISQPLLALAVQDAAKQLSGPHAVPVFAFLGDFHHLAEFWHLCTDEVPRRRIFTMLGYTFSNLDNEIQFLRRSLSLAQPGDYLVLDIPLAATDSTDPAEIRRRDPRLTNKRPEAWTSSAHRFFAGPIQRHLIGISSLEITPELDTSSCLVKGSYAVIAVAHVKLLNGEQKRFRVGYSKRYNTELLARHMESEGWLLRQTEPYGSGQALLCFQRRESSKSARKRVVATATKKAT